MGNAVSGTMSRGVVSMFSYRGLVTVGLLADMAVLRDPHAVGEQVSREIDVLVLARTSVGDRAALRGRRAA